MGAVDGPSGQRRGSGSYTDSKMCCVSAGWTLRIVVVVVVVAAAPGLRWSAPVNEPYRDCKGRSRWRAMQEQLERAAQCSSVPLGVEAERSTSNIEHRTLRLAIAIEMPEAPNLAKSRCDGGGGGGGEADEYITQPPGMLADDGRRAPPSASGPCGSRARRTGTSDTVLGGLRARQPPRCSVLGVVRRKKEGGRLSAEPPRERSGSGGWPCLPACLPLELEGQKAVGCVMILEYGVESLMIPREEEGGRAPERSLPGA
ncbi:hypothetical protein BC628DRAFT_686634 [Trametes gibbosa]|nr:hypothetical protein BC628DRAFT_686634 [Trametes gibbosa]